MTTTNSNTTDPAGTAATLDRSDMPPLLRLVHPVAGAVALLTIATFWISTVAVEALGTPADVARLKNAILWGMLVLVPAIAIAGASGMRLGRTSLHPLIEAKQSRMPIIALNGLLVLVPAAFFLADRAAAGMLDQVFYTVQAIELAAGAFNFYLIVLAMRDGFQLSGRFGFLTAGR